MNPNVTYHITKSRMVFMIIIAALFDLGILASKALYLIGLAVLGAAAGAYLGDAIGIPETGAAAGGVIGTLLAFTGIGTILSFAVGMLLAEALSWLLMFVGFSTIWFWLRINGVSMLSGRKIPAKFGSFMLSVVIKFVPILNVVPMITFWTWRMAMISRWEDRERAKGVKIPVGRSRIPRTPRRQVAQRNQPVYEEVVAA